MSRISLISPLDQPLNNVRLLDILKESMEDDSGFTSLRFVVAYAKSGVLAKLEPSFVNWSSKGASSKLFVGIDQKVTSKEALEKAVTLFDHAFIINHKSVTFHPKIYLFRNDVNGRVIVGSNNLTVGGLESNFESAVIIDYDLESADEAKLFNDFWNSLDSLLLAENGISIQLDRDLIEKLHAENLLAVETKIPGFVDTETKFQKRSALLDELFSSGFSVSASQSAKKNKDVASKRADTSTKVAANTKAEVGIAESAVTTYQNTVTVSSFDTFLIQIKPHHNGEIFLSKKAVNERPYFFEFPFNGRTTPKNPKNPSYPQRDPDPVVNILVYGSNYDELLKLEKYQLNTVFYEAKSEIRITCSQLVGIVPEYSIMIMNKPKGRSVSEFDYELIIHTPDSPDYDMWVSKCDKKMPSGGKKPRGYGWL
ncbi:hypothetical protein GCM10010919_06050 [Alishewanella longhuensis]|uniref:Phospholipase D-like domain-containing protein n=1 Tax=Alishewanella longhuensis TaxID=1091037 RepID=A0ABQ3KW87_9ALTE|nr:phospholipase D-like domain-containing protein [Alishewanella longhuensis]GHG61514.1 hypothetical protein GCM10010919_06050 [Alishewanella longhuensis]